MGSVTTLTLNDGQATPESHDFEPARVSENVVKYHDREDSVILGYPEITLGNRLPTKENGNYKCSLKVRIPVLETAATAASGFTPGPTLAYSVNANVDMIIPERATEDERKDLNAFLKNALAHAAWTSLVEDFDLPY